MIRTMTVELVMNESFKKPVCLQCTQFFGVDHILDGLDDARRHLFQHEESGEAHPLEAFIQIEAWEDEGIYYA